MRPHLLALALALAHGCAPKATPPTPAPGAAQAPDSAVSFGQRAASGVAPTGALLPLGGGALPADAAGTARPPPPGARISMEVVDADLHHVLRLIGEVAHLDFVVDDAVQATVTVKLVEVPWNYALQAILAAHGLTARPLAGGGLQVVALDG